MGDSNSQNEILGSKKTRQKGQNNRIFFKSISVVHVHNRSNTYLHPAAGTYSAIDLTMCDPYLLLDYGWKVHDDTCGSDYFPILLENSTDALCERTPNWNLEKANWDGLPN